MCLKRLNICFKTCFYSIILNKRPYLYIVNNAKGEAEASEEHMNHAAKCGF